LNGINGNFAGIELKNVTNGYISNVIAINTFDGFNLDSSSNNITLIDNTAGGNSQFGFALYGANNTLIGNTATNNVLDGFYLSGSSGNNTLTRNNATDNSRYGFLLHFFNNNNTFTMNTATNNTYGFNMHDSNNNTLTSNKAISNQADGFRLFASSNNNTLINNTAINNVYNGFYLDQSSSNELNNNLAQENQGYGVYVTSTSYFNLIYYNFLTKNNAGQGYDSESSFTNNWTNTTHGNFYSDYTGVDLNGDGIGETNYTLAGGFNHNDTKPLFFLLIISTPPDYEFNRAYNASGLQISWFPSTNFYPFDFILYQNEIVIDSGPWQSGVAINSPIFDDLTLGTHNFTLVVQDILLSEVKDTVIVTVLDTTAPVITCDGTACPTTLTIAVEYIYIYTINLMDNYPANFSVYKNDSLITTEPWQSGAISIYINPTSWYLDLGVYEIRIEVRDLADNISTHILILTVQDTTVPVITCSGASCPSELTMQEGSSGIFSITATDSYPETYTVFNNDSVFQAGSWVSDVAINVDLSGLSIGAYNITCVFFDESENFAFHTITVIVEEEVVPTEPTTPTTDTTPTTSTGTSTSLSTSTRSSSRTSTTSTTTSDGGSSPGWSFLILLSSFIGLVVYRFKKEKHRK
jgi:parallel beta-helix repeat protein